MKGNIYTNERCPACGSRLVHDENVDAFVCTKNPQHAMVMPRRMRVKFGSTYTRFREYGPARQFLEGLRFKTVEGSYDERDYQKSSPLGFKNQIIKYLAIKKVEVSEGQYRDIKRYLERAAASWKQTNVKLIKFAEIQDFLFSMEGVSNKTRANARSVLHSFFAWLTDREEITMPKFPRVDFELGWRNIVDIETQQAILEEIRRQTWHINPKIWIAIHWLCTYVAFRPDELRNLRERHIDVDGFFVVPSPKEKHPKLIAMLDEDIDLYHSITPRGLPDMYFFRHVKGNGLAQPSQQFGEKYLYRWWITACSSLGISGVDLYGGTRHSSATALSEHFSEAEIMAAATMHKSNKAARRYIQAKKNKSIQVYQQIRKMQKPGSKVVKVDFEKQDNKR